MERGRPGRGYYLRERDAQDPNAREPSPESTLSRESKSVVKALNKEKKTKGRSDQDGLKSPSTFPLVSVRAPQGGQYSLDAKARSASPNSDTFDDWEHVEHEDLLNGHGKVHACCRR